MIQKTVSSALTLLTVLSLSACASTAPAPVAPAPEPAPEAEAPEPAPEPLAPVQTNTDRLFVEGVAGGAMRTTVTLEAEVVAVDQEKREAILRGPEGKELAVRVGEDAVNFYQVKAGDRVKVGMMRELVIYVNEDEKKKEEQGAVVAGAGAEEGEAPAGVVVATTKTIAKIKAMDLKARTATLAFDDGETQFEVRPDVDMKRYKVGQEVVFLMTEMLALEVEKL